VPGNLSERIISFYEYQSSILEQSSTMTKELPHELAMELNIQLYKSLIKFCPIFTHLSNPQVLRLLIEMRPVVLMPCNIVIAEGRENSSIFFVSRGVIHVWKDFEGSSRQLLVTLVANDFFGEMSALGNGVATATAECVSFCELLMLHKDAFMKVLFDVVQKKQLSLDDLLKESVVSRELEGRKNNRRNSYDDILKGSEVIKTIERESSDANGNGTTPVLRKESMYGRKKRGNSFDESVWGVTRNIRNGSLGRKSTPGEMMRNSTGNRCSGARLSKRCSFGDLSPSATWVNRRFSRKDKPEQSGAGRKMSWGRKTSAASTGTRSSTTVSFRAEDVGDTRANGGDDPESAVIPLETVGETAADPSEDADEDKHSRVDP